MNLSQLHHDVVFRRSHGQILWQPRIACWYSDKRFAREPLPPPYEGMTLPAIYRSLGCSHRLYSWYNPCFRRIEPPSVRRIEERLNATDTKTTVAIPRRNDSGQALARSAGTTPGHRARVSLAHRGPAWRQVAALDGLLGQRGTSRRSRPSSSRSQSAFSRSTTRWPRASSSTTTIMTITRIMKSSSCTARTSSSSARFYAAS